MTDAGYDKTQILSHPLGSAEPAEPAEPVKSKVPPAVLRCVDTSVLKDSRGEEIRLDGSALTIGRGSDSNVTLNAEGVSRHHARLFPEDGAWQVEDLGSTNGTRVNNSMVQKRELESGDTVVFGRVCYKYTVLDTGSSTASSHTIDLGAADQTMVMSPVAAQEVNAALESGDTERTTRLRAAGSAKTVRGATSRPRPVAPDSGGSGGTWVVVAVLAAAIVAGGAYMLGIF